jgi:hypothetical protein
MRVRQYVDKVYRSLLTGSFFVKWVSFSLQCSLHLGLGFLHFDAPPHTHPPTKYQIWDNSIHTYFLSAERPEITDTLWLTGGSMVFTLRNKTSFSYPLIRNSWTVTCCGKKSSEAHVLLRAVDSTNLPVTFESRTPWLLGRCSRLLRRSPAGANMVYSRAERVFILEHHFASTDDGVTAGINEIKLTCDSLIVAAVIRGYCFNSVPPTVTSVYTVDDKRCRRAWSGPWGALHPLTF